MPRSRGSSRSGTRARRRRRAQWNELHLEERHECTTSIDWRGRPRSQHDVLLRSGHGRRRRAWLGNQLTHLVHCTGHSIDVTSRDITNRVRGVAAEMSAHARDEYVADTVVVARVRAACPAACPTPASDHSHGGQPLRHPSGTDPGGRAVSSAGARGRSARRSLRRGSARATRDGRDRRPERAAAAVSHPISSRNTGRRPHACWPARSAAASPLAVRSDTTGSVL